MDEEELPPFIELAGGILTFAHKEESLNAFFFKHGQLPLNWIYKGMQHKRDAESLYKWHENDREFIISELKKNNFQFEYFFRDELKRSISKILSENTGRILPDFEAFYYFYHLSIENFLKAIWLDQNVDLLGFKKLPKIIHTHDLIKLANLTELKLSQDEKNTLTKLTSLSQSYCKYPIKLEVFENNKKQESKNWDMGGMSFETACFNCLNNPYRIDRHVLNNFFQNKLEKKLQAISENHYNHLKAVSNKQLS